MVYEYVPEILTALAGHGLVPGPMTRPARARDALSDLYRYEIRQLRASLLAGDFPKDDYSNRVIALRKRYWLLSVPVALWAAAR